AGRGVERDDGAAAAGCRIQHAVHHQRRRLEVECRARAERVGLEPPGDLEVLEIARGDLIERRGAGAGEIAAVSRPLGVFHANSGPDEHADDRQESERSQTKTSGATAHQPSIMTKVERTSWLARPSLFDSSA